MELKGSQCMALAGFSLHAAHLESYASVQVDCPET